MKNSNFTYYKPLTKQLPVVLLLLSLSCFAQNDEVQLYNRLLNETPILENLHELCDEIGGRVTGTEANMRSIDWAMNKFKEAGVKCWKEKFTVKRKWEEISATAEVKGASYWNPKITCRAFSTGTDKDGMEADLVWVGRGTKKAFNKVKDKVKGNFILVETPVMSNLTQLFLEYIDAIEIENNAINYGAAGVVYMSSRSKKLLYRHLTSFGIDNQLPMVVMARDDATRCKRLLKRGKMLRIKLNLDVVDEGAFNSYNVMAEIEGKSKKDEVILLGAHIDSWGLGTGANDNGCNVNMLIDIARQITAMNIQPERTIRFALWNGEEQGMIGSYQYTQRHLESLDMIKMKIAIDIGSGKINGFFLNGRPEMDAYLQKLLSPLDSLGLEHTEGVIVGTDNYDFFAQGVPNIVGKHKVHNYCDDYHSESDTYDKVNKQNLKDNTALVGFLGLKLANDEKLNFKRMPRKKIQTVINEQELKEGMKALRLWDGWTNGTRGIR